MWSAKDADFTHPERARSAIHGHSGFPEEAATNLFR